MNKKVKWSAISVTTVAFLTFAGLVTGNSNNSNSDSQTVAGIDQGSNTDPFTNSDSNEQFQQGGETFPGHGHGRGGQDSFSSEWGNNDSSSEDSTNQADQYFQAPSSGFSQGHGSSGSSKE